MGSPFPGMDPYLEHPAFWPDVHNSLVAAIRENLAPQVAPRYYIGLERRVYRLGPEDMVFLGRPDLSVLRTGPPAPLGREKADVAVVEVEVPVGSDEAGQYYLEVREQPGGTVVTVLELLSPVNKCGSGRREYLDKRDQILRSATSLVEIDLLRAGEPMPLVLPAGCPVLDYRILVSRGADRPKAQLYAFGLRQPIPPVPLPLAPGDQEPSLELNAILHDLYDRVHFELLVDYAQAPVPGLSEEDQGWAAGLCAVAGP